MLSVMVRRRGEVSRMVDRCGTCRFYRTVDYRGVVYTRIEDGGYREIRPNGECRKRSPDVDSCSRMLWPCVPLDEWCGDYEACSGHSDTTPTGGGSVST